MAFNLGDIFKIIQLAPYVYAGIDAVHKEASTATKTQLAQDSLNLALSTFNAVVPSEAATATAVGSSVNSIISAIASMHDTIANSNTTPPTTPTV